MEYFDSGHTFYVCPPGTEGQAIFDFRGARPEVNYWKIKVKNQAWGSGWITVREDGLEFLD